MASRRLIAPVLLLLSLSPASAQFQFRTGNLQVRVTFADGRPCNIRAHVQLMGSASTSPVAENYTNDNGMTSFNNIEIGDYHLIVSGQGIEETDSGLFEIDSRRTSQFLYVTVRPTHKDGQTTPTDSNTVGAADFQIPEGAAKEFDKATALMAKSDWKRAIERLDRALAIYPQYAAAYNNLGVVYSRLGDRNREREALQKAITLNDHFAPAFVNLARMAISDRDFPSAEGFLDKATGMDPANSQNLILLANVELLDRHYDQAIATSRKVHFLGQGSHALVHYVAARAFEHQNRISDAVAEFQIFLNEEPSGERAQAVRKELAGLQSQSRSK
jgi:tetratricopeptide (TPR) repeat protein